MTKKIILIGAVNRGKSTLGKLVAEKLGMKHMDLDEMIKTYVMESGHLSSLLTRFLEYQGMAIDEVMECDEPIVLSTGAEILLNPHRLELLGKDGFIIHVKRDSDLSVNRESNLVMECTSHHADGTVEKEIYDQEMFAKAYDEDLHRYDAAADAVMENNGTIEEGVEKLLDLIRQAE